MKTEQTNVKQHPPSTQAAGSEIRFIRPGFSELVEWLPPSVAWRVLRLKRATRLMNYFRKLRTIS